MPQIERNGAFLFSHILQNSYFYPDYFPVVLQKYISFKMISI
jgi:hypothetical protein